MLSQVRKFLSSINRKCIFVFMKDLQFYAANLYSLDCERTAVLYQRLFSLSILSSSKNHAELRSSNGFSIFIDKPSIHCNVTPGTKSFCVSELNESSFDLDPLSLESFHEKEKYASFLDEYQNRIWIFEKK